LQARSINTPTRAPREDRLSKAISAVGEDGEDLNTTAKRRRLGSAISQSRRQTLQGTSPNEAAQVLHDLLDNTPSSQPFKKPIARSASRVRSGADETTTPIAAPLRELVKMAPMTRPNHQKRPHLEEHYTRLKKSAQAGPAKARAQQSLSPPPVRPEDEPLRSRPLSRLNLDDFKINPSFRSVDGRDYAYTETVRKRDERQCLPGCTAECCRAIRDFVAMGDLPEPARRQLFGSSQEDDTELTLRGYLGHGYEDRVGAADAQERERLLVEARTRVFADRHGRHRQAFARAKSPPGFWRTDMPTTQELDEDRVEAARLDRIKVEERWREAMRQGASGRFIFRDE